MAEAVNKGRDSMDSGPSVTIRAPAERLQIRFAIVIAIVALVVASAGSAGSFLAARSLIQETEASNKSVCQEVEGLKQLQRELALENFANLDKSLALLNIKKTPALIALSINNRDKALKRYAADPCPRT